jgi:hypothetical protein
MRRSSRFRYTAADVQRISLLTCVIMVFAAAGRAGTPADLIFADDFEPHSSVWSGDGNRVQLVYPTSRILDYEYDAVNRVKQVIAPFESAGRTTVIADFSWIGPGPCNCYCPCDSRPLLLAMGNGTGMSFLDPSGTAAVGYNDVKEVVGLSHLFGSAAFIDREYNYNRASMRTGENLLDVLGSPSDAFTFDSVYRVANTFIGADGSSEGLSTEMDYTLDGVGNRETVDFTQIFNAGGSATFTDNYLGNIMNEYDSAGGGGCSGPRRQRQSDLVCGVRLLL